MKKLNLIAASAALLVTGLANAGSLTAATSGGTVFAAENFGGGTSASAQNALGIKPGSITYSTSGITAVNAGSSVYFTVRLAGGLFGATPVASDFSFGGSTSNAIGTITVSSDKTTVLVQATANTSNGVTLGLGAFSYTPSGTGTSAEINNVSSTLATVGGQVTATVGMTTTAPSSIEASTAQTTVDLPLASAVVAVSAAAESGAVSGTNTAGTKIDLTVSPAGSKFTGAATSVALGSVTFTDVTGTQSNITTGADYTLASGSTAASTPASPSR